MKSNFKRNGQLRNILLAGSIISSVVAFAPVFAQDAQTEEEKAKAAAAAASTKSETVVVVGSRIRKDTFNSASPIQVITRAEATAAGLTSTAAILQSTAVTGGSNQVNNAFGGFVVDGGPGVATVGLRGMSPGRTLVLINGHRVAPAGSRGSIGAADLNVLPNALIGRVDILQDGASAIYGSDAVAGVINIVTKKADGFDVEVQASLPAGGGGETYRASIAGGKTWDKLSASGSVEYFEQKRLALGDRDWATCSQDYYLDPVTGERYDYIDPLTGEPKCYTLDSNGVTVNTLGTALYAGVGAPGSVGATFNRWRPNTGVTTGLSGFEGVGNNFTSTAVRDTFAPYMLNSDLLSGAKILTMFGQADYKVDDNLTIYGEVLANRRESRQIGDRQLVLDYVPGSPLIPANIAAIPGNAGSGSLITTTGAYKARAFIGWGNDESKQENDFYKVTLGVKGDVLAFNGWEYDGYVSYAKSDSDYGYEQFLTNRLYNSLDVVAAAAGVPTQYVVNGLTCRVNNTLLANSNCVPAPALNSQTLAGVLPENFRDYIMDMVWGNTQYSEATVNFTLDGPVYKLPAGEVQAAIGVEGRFATISDIPSMDMQTGNLYNFSTSTITEGHDGVIEVFGELNVPVLKDAPFAKKLDIELAGRWTDYQSYGDDTTYKAGIVYQPFDWLTLRGSKGTSFRAPALYEQFLGPTSGFLASTSDPCNNWDAPNTPATRKANCAAEGLEAGFTAKSSIKVVSAGGAATKLEAETATNNTWGFVFTPTFLPKDVFGKIAFAVDAFEILVDNGVDRVGSSTLLSLCYNNPDFRAGGSWCNFSSRDPLTKALTVNRNYTNIARDVARGYDYNLRWDHSLAGYRVLMNAKLTQYTEQSSAIFSTDPLFDSNGLLANPKLTGDLGLNISRGSWNVRYGMEWTQGQDSNGYYGVDPTVDSYIFDVDDYYIHNMSVTYKGKGWSATGGVRNIADEIPPVISAGTTLNRVGNSLLYSGYDFAGRSFFFNVSKHF